MKVLHTHDFNVLRTHNNFYAEDLGNGYTFSSFINDTNVSTPIRSLLLSIVKTPFIADDDSYEAEVFIVNTFTSVDINDTIVSPEGLAVAYVNNSPTISLTGHSKWESETIPISISSANDDIKTVYIVNIYSIESIENQAFKNWIKGLTDGTQLNSEQNIHQVFSPALFEFTKRAINDIIFWYYNDKRFIIRIKELINDIIKNPFTGGKGLTETLSGLGGKSSKRIIKQDRIVYTYTKEKITIHQCRGHYDDN